LRQDFPKAIPEIPTQCHDSSIFNSRSDPSAPIRGSIDSNHLRPRLTRATVQFDWSASCRNRRVSAPKSLEIETRIAFEDNPLKEGIMSLGEASAFTCPECHGGLIEITNGKLVRFQCHTGHAFSINSLLAELAESTENTLWSAVRAIDENIMLLDHMAQHARQADKLDLAKMLARKSEESKQQADVLRKAAFTQAAINSEQLDEKESKTGELEEINGSH